MRSRSAAMAVAAVSTLILASVAGVGAGMSAATTTRAPAVQRMALNCRTHAQFCTDVADSEQVWGEHAYVGHDEPSTLFYSKKAGSGANQLYTLRLPKDPSPKRPLTKTYEYQDNVTFWFGMAMCDTQSYPNTVRTCSPANPKNDHVDATSPVHPGTAFMEMQFYPPGGVPWPAGASCDPHKWCAALNIDSLSTDPNGDALNDTCAKQVGLEYVNFAFITKNGQPHAAPNPVNSTVDTFTPNSSTDLLMNSGDTLKVKLQDTASGLRIDINDRTTGQSGFMTASADNGFGMVAFKPNPSTECTNIPYDFHPMYSTSTTNTRVPWSAHTYNISYAEEIGHFDFCSDPQTDGTCQGSEGRRDDVEPADGDNTACFPASASLLVKVNGCYGQNQGFDGVGYHRGEWPNGTKKTPTPVYFTSPLTGSRFNKNFQKIGFESDVPRITAVEDGGTCNRLTDGSGCFRVPRTDDNHAPAAFYPFFSTTKALGGCAWTVGGDVPGVSKKDFGGVDQYGDLLKVPYSGPQGTVIHRYNDFRNILSKNPCPAE